MNLLQIEYVPEEILHREREIKEMAYLFKQPLLNRPPENILIYGRSGTGKTMTVLQMTKYLKEECERRKIKNIKVFYINCSKAKTPITITRKLCQTVNIPYSANDTDELMSSFLKKIDKERNLIIIILDEIDKLKHDQDKDWIIRYLVRAREGYQFGSSAITNSFIGLICIVNDTLFTEKLNVGTMDSFGKTHIIRFPPYTENQLYDILKVRINKSLKKEAIEDKLIHEIAKYSKDLNAEARTAIQLLRESAIIAEQSNSNKITIDNILSAKQKIESQNIWQEIRDLSKHEKWAYLSLLIVFELMNDGKQIKDVIPARSEDKELILSQINTIFSVYKTLLYYYGNQNMVAERQFRRYFTETFNSQGIIKSKSIGRLVIYAPTLPCITTRELLMNELINEKEKLDSLLPNEIFKKVIDYQEKEIANVFQEKQIM
jgi:cell division control protein 6